ncbi:MAG TPA: hypothetical protein VFE05_01815 [Longimicrobiaceae bacterium]|jgi:hypothetical protein|nr:hypothetical protein [Longimicrobiaceae bacterium]
MIPSEILERIVSRVEAAGIPYMVTGSLASGFHGPYRGTMDIDLVIRADAEKLREFARSLPRPGYYVDERAALEALASEGMFNVVDNESGWKVDLIVRKSRPFSIAEFERRQSDDLFGVRVWVASAEDVVISKLEWATLGESRRQLEDVAGVLNFQGAALDLDYIGKWVAELGLGDAWAEARRIATSAA